MTESALKAIIRLFAIISQLLPEKKQDAAAGIVASYLKNLVDHTKVNYYLIIYRFYLKEFAEKSNKREIRKDPLFSVKTLLVCEQLNKQLLQKQKILVIIQLLDILSHKGSIENTELDLIMTLTTTLHFNPEIFYNCKAFVFDTIDKIPDQQSVLLIDSYQSHVKPDLKHWRIKNLKGNIIFLYIKETHDFVFRFSNPEDKILLNGRDISPNRTYSFTKGSVLRSILTGTIHYSDVFRIFFSHRSDLKFTLSVVDLEFRFKQSDGGILPFSLSLESGQLVGMMGSSGVGKSTLINLFNGNLKPSAGKVLINGFNVFKDREKLHGIIGYVPQEDLLIEELTVFQNLYFNAKLCFGDNSEAEIRQFVTGTLTDLDLYYIKDMKVGGPLNKFISGGQRKRLNISLELIRQPSLLFVDEPTSGLSSSDSEMVIDLLKDQTQKGKLVVINIHQPSSDIFKVFDKLLIIDKGGRIIFTGNPADAPLYFKSVRQLINADEGECITCGNLNPEQIFQIIEAKEFDDKGRLTGNRIITPEQWYDLYKKNIESGLKEASQVKTHIPPGMLKIPDKLRQFRIFFVRNFLSKLSDRQYMLINLLEAPLLALILGIFTKYNSGNEQSAYAYVFSKNVNLPVYIFMSVIVSLFLGLMVSAEEIIRDRRIIQRESFLNLSRFSYYNSKVAWLLVLSALQVLLFIVLGNYIMGIKGMFFPYWLVLLSSAVFSNFVGLNISDSLKSVIAIYILIPLLLVPQILLGGAMVKFDKLNKRLSSQQYVPIIGDLMASRWAYEALAVYQFMYNNYEKHLYTVEQQESESSFKVNYLIPELKLKLDRINRTNDDSGNQTDFINNISIIKNEVCQLAGNDKRIPPFSNIESLTPEMFNAGLAVELDRYLTDLRGFYLKVMNRAIDEKDRMIENLGKNAGGKAYVLKLRLDYYNQNLAEEVLNKRDNDKIIEFKNQLIQKADPIFHIPESEFGRAHFFAPGKRIGNILINTFWFDLIVLWLFNALMYISLLTGLFKKGLNWFSSLNLKKTGKK